MSNNLPQNPQAERAVIGACLCFDSESRIGEISEILKPEDFYNVNNKIAYEICVDMYFANKPVDGVTFQDEAIKRGVFNQLGGQPFLAELMNDTAIIANAGYYAEIVKSMSLRRKIIEAGNQISSLGFKNELENSELIESAEKILLNSSSEKESSAPVAVKNSAPSILTKIKELKEGTRKNAGFLTNFKDLDAITAGLQPGTLNIIAARPSMGKTALALNIAQFGGDKEANKHILFFSLEMSQEQLIQRMISAQTCESGFGSAVKLSAIKSGIMSDYDFYVVENAVRHIQNQNIHIYDTSELTAMEFRTKCRRFQARHQDLALIIVDYLQLMNSGKKQSDNRQYEVAEISRIMKSVAVELNCPVIALSQLSRETERRNTKKPQLSDLRDSGAIEQDADTVILLYREDYYGENENNSMMYSTADIRIAKNRNGSTGSCKLTFQREYTRFRNHGSY